MVKHKQWVADVTRFRGEKTTRHGKLRLDKNERVTPFPAEFLAEVQALVTSDALAAYPETEQLYEALANLHGLSIEHFVLTAGSDGAIRHCFDLFVQPGDGVVVLDPTFAMIDVYCGLFKANRTPVGYNQALELDTEKFFTAIDERTTLVVIANPNSPTGTLIEEEKLVKILEHAQKHNTAVLVDEAYFGFCPYTAIPLINKFSNLIVSRTFSKTYGLAGIRVGYLVANPEIAGLLYKFKPMYEVNSIGVLAALYAMRNSDRIEAYLASANAGYKYLVEELDRRGIAHTSTCTNFLHIDFGANKEKASSEFSKRNILVRGGLNIPTFENFLRISTGPIESMISVIEVIDFILSKGAEHVQS